MADSFKALVINQEGENFNREIKSIEKSFIDRLYFSIKIFAFLVNNQGLETF